MNSPSPNLFPKGRGFLKAFPIVKDLDGVNKSCNYKLGRIFMV